MKIGNGETKSEEYLIIANVGRLDKADKKPNDKYGPFFTRDGKRYTPFDEICEEA